MSKTKVDYGFSVRLSSPIGKKVRTIAAREQRTIKAVVERAIESYEKKSER